MLDTGSKEGRMPGAPKSNDHLTDAPDEPLRVVADRSSDRIAQRAYERYEARGRGDGHDLEDWFEAERELRDSEETGNRD